MVKLIIMIIILQIFVLFFFNKKSLELFQDCVLNARVQRDVCKVLIKCYWIFLHSSTGRR